MAYQIETEQIASGLLVHKVYSDGSRVTWIHNDDGTFLQSRGAGWITVMPINVPLDVRAAFKEVTLKDAT